MMLFLLAAAAETGGHEVGIGPFIAGGIAVAVFTISAIVVRSFRDVSHRSTAGQADATEHH